ncbi:MAG: DUF58 domain-containing protein [Hyphomicrobiaceae bacterium]
MAILKTGGPTRQMVDLQTGALALAERLPSLVLEARRIATTVMFGIHGRRRPGPGETFWQFRQLEAGDARHMIDWRRSASSDRLFVREKEWEAAHTAWLWADQSPSMVFQSALGKATKQDRALVLMLAIAELLVEGGERVGVLGLTSPSARRHPAEHIAERIFQEIRTDAPMASLPPEATLTRYSECILIGDFLEPIEDIAQRVGALAGQGVRGHLVQVLDPAEETLPYEGRVEFLDLEDGGALLAEWTEGIRGQYQERLEAHRAALRHLADRLQWSLLVHRTDHPPEQAMLALHQHISEGLGRTSSVDTPSLQAAEAQL